MATLQWIIQNGNYVSVGGISGWDVAALKSLYSEQNAPFISYPDFSQILIDFDRNVDSNTGTIDIYWVAVDALSQSNTKTTNSTSHTLQLPYSWTKSYKIAWNFSFRWGEIIGEMITCKFWFSGNGSGSWQYLKAKVTPKIFLVHMDGTTSNVITYPQSATVSGESSPSTTTEYTAKSSTYLTAQYGDKLVLQYDFEYVSGYGLPTASFTRWGNVYSVWNPTQISVR